MLVNVTIADVQGLEAVAPFQLEIGDATAHVVPELKRLIAAQLRVNPVLLRLKLDTGTDRFRLPLEVIATRRTSRPGIRAVAIQDFGCNVDPWLVDVSALDTVLDLKFLLAEQTGDPAENHDLYTDGQPLDDAMSVAQAGCFNPKTLTRVLYSIPSASDGHGDVRRAIPFAQELVSFGDPACSTLGELWRRSVREYGSPTSQLGDLRLFGERSWAPDGTRGAYEWSSFSTLGRRVDRIAAGLRSLGVAPGAAVGVIALNRTSWQAVDLACFVGGFVSVPLYDTLGPTACQYVINHAQIQAVICSPAKLPEIAAARASSPSLTTVILMDDYPSEKVFITRERQQQQKQKSAADFELTLSELEARGNNASLLEQVRVFRAKPDDVATLAYTSGTTGNPKGVIVTHRNMLSGLAGIRARIPKRFQDTKETMISYLPLAHIYERVLELSSIQSGNAVGYFQGDVTLLVSDIEALSPSFVPGVPRVWQRIHDKVSAQLAESGAIKRALFNHAYGTQQGALRSKAEPSALWNRIVFQKIADRFGGKLKFVSTGSAPLAGSIAEWLKICLLVDFGEGYGLSETCAALTTTSVEETEYGHVGSPVPSCEVKLVSVPDMNYLVTDKPEPRGEVWVRGPNVFPGYYKQADLTAEAITADGWFQTGDVGKWRTDGNLAIIDRKKNIFKLSQGEYVRPEVIENVYKRARLVANCFVYGDSLQQFLVAIVVPDPETLAVWARQQGGKLSQMSVDELVGQQEVRWAIEKEMKRVAKDELRGFECVKKITLVAEDFSVENGLLTPSMKLKRHQAKEHFWPQIQALYDNTATLQAKL